MTYNYFTSFEGLNKKMFVLVNREQINKAAEKARKVRTRVRYITLGNYQVTGSNGKLYTVTMTRGENGEKKVSCDCKGGESGLVCYHAAGALSLHVGLVRQRQAIVH